MPDDKQKQHKLAAIILNWNDFEGTARTINALLEWRELNPAIVVVDNASNDGSGDTLSREYPNAVILRSESNLGFSGGNNLGIRYALNKGFDRILLLNTDAKLSENAAMTLVSAMDTNPKIGIIGPLIAEARDGSQTLTAGGRSMALYPSTRIALPEGTNIQENKIEQVVYVPGTALLASSSLFRSTGLLDELYFFSGEIADLCRRARQAGFVCAIHYGAKATHHKVFSSPNIEYLHAYYTLRNRFLYIRKHCGLLIIFLFPYWIICGLYMWIKGIFSRDWMKARTILLALRDGITGQYGNRNERFLS